MPTDPILERRALRLKAALSEEKNKVKSSFFSTIYPAMDHGKNAPPKVKTHSSIPEVDDKEEKSHTSSVEKAPEERDEPGPSKTTSSSLPVVPGESALVPPAHKKTMLGVSCAAESRSDAFVKRCIETITGIKKVETTNTPQPPSEQVNTKADHSRLSAAVGSFIKQKV